MSAAEKALREALTHILHYPKLREYIGSQLADAADAALALPETVQVQAEPVAYLERITGQVRLPYEDHRLRFPQCYTPLYAAPPSQPAQGEQQAAYPHIIEALSWHRFERDDMTADELVEVIRRGYVKVRQRTHRQLELQLLEALAAAPAAPTPPLDASEGEIGQHQAREILGYMHRGEEG